MHLAAKLLQSKGKQLDSLWEKSRKQPFVFFFLICSNNEIVVLTAQMSTVCCVKGLRIELVVTCSFTVVAVWIVLRWQLLVTQLLSFCILYNLFHIHSFFFRCTLCPVALYRFLHVLCETFYFRPKTHICDYQAIKALLHSAAHPLLTVLVMFFRMFKGFSGSCDFSVLVSPHLPLYSIPVFIVSDCSPVLSFNFIVILSIMPLID